RRTWSNRSVSGLPIRRRGDRVDVGLLHCICPLLAQSGHASRAPQCPLLGVKRTYVLRCPLLTQSGHEKWQFAVMQNAALIILPNLRSHASFWVFIKSASERQELKQNSSVPFPARQWERVLDFMSLAVPFFAFASRQCTFQVKVCSSCYWLALLRVGWPGSLWQVAGLGSSPISQVEFLW